MLFRSVSQSRYMFGMLAGIGVIIILKQIPHALGYDKDFEGNLQIFDGFNLSEYLSGLADAITPGAVLVTIISLAILITWLKNYNVD